MKFGGIRNFSKTKQLAFSLLVVIQSVGVYTKAFSKVCKKQEGVQFLVLGERSAGKSVLASLLKDLGQNVHDYRKSWIYFENDRQVVNHAQYRYDLKRYQQVVLDQRIIRTSDEAMDHLMVLSPYAPFKSLVGIDGHKGWVRDFNFSEEVGEDDCLGTLRCKRFSSKSPRDFEPSPFRLKFVDVPGVSGSNKKDVETMILDYFRGDRDGENVGEYYQGILLVINGKDPEGAEKMLPLIKHLYSNRYSEPRLMVALTHAKDWLNNNKYSQDILTVNTENDAELDIIRRKVAKSVEEALTSDSDNYYVKIPYNNVFLFENERYVISEEMGKIFEHQYVIRRDHPRLRDDYDLGIEGFQEKFQKLLNYLEDRRNSLKFSQKEGVRLFGRLSKQRLYDRMEDYQPTGRNILRDAKTYASLFTPVPVVEENPIPVVDEQE